MANLIQKPKRPSPLGVQSGSNPFSGANIEPQTEDQTTGSNPFSGAPITPNPQMKGLLDIVNNIGNMNGEVDLSQIQTLGGVEQDGLQPAPETHNPDQFGGLNEPISSETQPVSNTPQMSQPSPLEPQTPLQTQTANLESVLNQPVKKQGKLAQGVYMAMQAIRNIASGNPTQEITWLGNDKKKAEVEKAREALAPLQQQEEWKNQQAMVKAKTGDIAADNKRQSDVLREQKRKNFYSRYKFFDPATATPAQKAEAAEFGETPESIGKYDFTNPKNRAIAGEDFQFDPTDKSWKTTGLKDPSKAIVEFDVQDPDDPTNADGSPKYTTYKTTSEKAAGLKTSLAVAKLNIIAARENNNANRQQDVKKFNAGNQIKVAVENANNIQKYNSDFMNLVKEQTQLSGKNIENQGEIDAIVGDTQRATEEYARLGQTDTSQLTGDQIKDLNEQMQKLHARIDKNNKDFDIALAKTEGGRAALANATSRQLVRPQQITYKPIEAVQVKTNTGKTVPKSKDPMGLYQ